jgi:short-subunit dehydrogenase
LLKAFCIINRVVDRVYLNIIYSNWNGESMENKTGNKMALVTGASDGIGVEFCKTLAGQGYDLILVARREQKLQEVAAALSHQYKIDCIVIPADLSEPQAAQKLFQTVKTKQLNVDFLVNNAGLLANGFFTELDLSNQENMLMVNILALTSLTHLFANDMACRGGGHILNLASLAAWTPIPNENVYAASKAYVLSFSQALADEMKATNNGVVITALCPGYTATKMLNNPEQGGLLKIPSALISSAELVAKKGINDCLAGKTTIIPGLSNQITAYVSQLFSKMMVARLMGKMYRKNMT